MADGEQEYPELMLKRMILMTAEPVAKALGLGPVEEVLVGLKYDPLLFYQLDLLVLKAHHHNFLCLSKDQKKAHFVQ